MKDDVQSLSHSKWRCKYHIVFAPKYRRRVVYGKIKEDVGKIQKVFINMSPLIKNALLVSAELCRDLMSARSPWVSLIGCPWASRYFKWLCICVIDLAVV